MTQNDLSPPRADAADVVRAAHHQIGNSLQSVASLLRLESRTAPPDAATVLSEAGRRVRAIMHLHQRLQEGGGDLVRLDDLLGDICRDVAELDAVDRNAEIRVDIEPLYAAPGAASALAMITAEWVGNALEHGLAKRAGVIEVKLELADGGARLTVADTGVGSSGGDWLPGFGTSLVSRLAQQLGGRISRSIDQGGSRFELTFPGAGSAPA
ncbi:sensor histidine kinase [Brevundimonas sp.]|uniref:sensor histidine kinase n=1 Tax=Brevundimonas sp. TaxID=1871086 RepID=UPI002D4F227B|nr:sensor histidine kinase [Brevundimonas sp.]HYD27691.1 sensor histidine kinase [Brevundimonas sp.]